jgi:succinate dehydrogenase / fumarate reductase iron-sulfur subunit
MKVTLKIWRQKDSRDAGRFVSYPTEVASPEMSMLELLDVLNESLIEKGEETIAARVSAGPAGS